MSRPNRILAFLLLGAILALAGCGGPSFGSQEDYTAARTQDFDIPESSGFQLEDANGNRYYIWQLRSGQAWVDALEGDSFNVDRSFPFGSIDEATSYVQSQGADASGAIDPDTYMADRAEELMASSGEYYANGDGGAYYLWEMQDGTWVRDFVAIDGEGFQIADTQTFASEAEATEGIERPGSFAQHVEERAAELNATPVWGTNARAWKLFAFQAADGTTTVDIADGDADPMTGAVIRESQQYDSLGAAVAGVTNQLNTPGSFWLRGSQYSRMGWLLILYVMVIVGLILWNIQAGRKGKGGTIRRIAGLDQIDEAVGRATEIARPVLMVPGLGVLNGITVQALTIFAYVIRTAARFGTPIRLLNADASVYAVAQEITRDVYMSEGVPEAYDPTSVRFVSDRQFAFAAGVAGTIQREKVAATFFMGDFYAESMIFAENANMVGAIQVAATTQFTQTPFFIAACDYVLLGDEFYAASAYLGRQPVLIGSLIGVDKSKMLVMVTVIVMCLVHSFQLLGKVDQSTLPPETQEVYEATGQEYLDWRKTELYFKRLPKIVRP